MSYQAFYRTYRPQKFSEVVGQKAVIKTLRNALSENKIAHAYLFCGPRGTGKTTMARLFAKALNCEEKEIAKTLSFLVNDEVILIVVEGDKKIDNAKYKAEFNTKAKMIPYDDVENYTGHKPGGVCPFGVKENVKVYLDESLKRFDIIYPACGSSNSAVKLTIAELEKTSNYEKWVDVCKDV